MPIEAGFPYIYLHYHYVGQQSSMGRLSIMAASNCDGTLESRMVSKRSVII